MTKTAPFLVVFLLLPLAATTAHASALSDAAEGLSAGEWVQLGTYSELVSAAADENGYNTFEYSFRPYWVRNGALGTGKLVHMGSGHISGEWHLVEYNEATDSWSRKSSADKSCHIHSYGQYTVNVSNGDIYANCLSEPSARPIYKWTGSSWQSGAVWPGGYSTLMGSAHFPERDEIWVVNGYSPGLYSYDISRDSWTSHGSNYNVAHSLDMVYSPIHQKVVFSGGEDKTGLYIIDIDGQVTTSSARTPYNWRVKTALADYDPVSGDIIIFFSQDDSIRRYNPTTDTLTNLGTFGSRPPFTWEGGDVWGGGDAILGTIPDYNVFVIANAKTGAVWLFKLAAGTGPNEDPPTAPNQAPQIR